MVNPQTLSIYLHIPFCRAMCTYCAFNTYVDLEDLIPAFVDAMIREVDFIGQTAPEWPVHTIYFGGGTPSLITPQQYEQLFAALHRAFSITEQAEIALETNPNDLKYDYLVGLREVGFNRLSIGMQSAQSHILKLFNREHAMQEVVDAVTTARSVGFGNVSLDLIFGVPKQTLAHWEDTLRQVAALNVEHISLYNLILEGNTPLEAQIMSGALPAPDDDLAADMYDLATELLAQSGFEQYEISNWAQSGFESIHNLQYWHNLPYLGLGPGAHGYTHDTRTIVLRAPQKYVQILSETHNPLDFPRTPAVSKAVHVDREAEIAETIMMGLRLVRDGISREVFKNRFGVDLVELKAEPIQKFVDYGLLYVDDTTVRLTADARLISNAVIRDLI